MTSVVSPRIPNYIKVPNAGEPTEGRRSFQMTLNFASDSEIELDMLQFLDQGYFSSLKSFYVDNSAASVSLTILGTGYGNSIVIPPNSCGRGPLYVQQPPRIFIRSSSALSIPLQLFNYHQDLFVWGVAGAGGSGFPVATTRTPNFFITTTSGTLAAGFRSVTISNTGSTSGTVLGIALASGEAVEWDCGLNDTLAAIAYDATGTTFKITTLI